MKGPDLAELEISQRTTKPAPLGGLFATEPIRSAVDERARVAEIAASNLHVPSDSLPAGSIYERWGKISKAQRQSQVERWKELLRPIIDETAAKHRGEGFIAADIQTAGALAGIINTSEVFLCQPFAIYRNAYAFIGPWLNGLALRGEISRVPDPRNPTTQLERKSTRPKSKGSPQKVFCGNAFVRPSANEVAA